MATTPLIQPGTPSARPVALQPIVFATDFSPASEAAFRKAVQMAKKEGADLVVAHVYAPPAGLSHAGVADDLVEAEIEVKVLRDVDARLEPVLARARAEGVRVSGEVLAGHPAHRLTELAARIGAAMIVIGTHGRTGMKRLVMGSVANEVIATAPCPVLTVR